MSELESIKEILYSKYIDPNNVKPYTGLHINTSGKRERKNKILEKFFLFFCLKVI